MSTLAAKTNTIGVCIQYRLNVFGFLATSSLSAADPRGTSGNYGFIDQQVGLQWIQRYISAFGGDPTRVLLMGQVCHT